MPGLADLDVKWSVWDTHCNVSLTQLGCRSSILNDKSKSIREKAECLYRKYFLFRSDLALNVGDFGRSKVGKMFEDLEEKNSSDDENDLVFVFIFDEAMKDVFHNLDGSMIRYKCRNNSEVS